MGLGVVEEERREQRLVACANIRTSSKAGAAERLLKVRDEFRAFVELYRPAALAIEGQYFHQQRSVAFSVGQAVGVVLLTAAERELPVFEYGPMQVKQALVGTGRADKAQVAFMVRAILGLRETPKSSHEADAIAIALTHLQSRRVAGAAR